MGRLRLRDLGRERSSRDVSGYDASANGDIVSLILQRAAPFLPALDISAAAAAAIVRVGLRPQSSGGLPLVRPLQLPVLTFPRTRPCRNPVEMDAMPPAHHWTQTPAGHDYKAPIMLPR